MKSKTKWLVFFCLAAVAANAYLNHGSRFAGGNSRTNPDLALNGNFEVGSTLLAEGEFDGAIKEFRPLAEGGNPDAQLMLATMYKRGDGVTADYAEAIKWYYLSAKQGNGIAQSGLGAIYSDGKGVSRNFQTAYKWYFISSLSGAPFSNAILD